MLNFPEVFESGSNKYDTKTEAIADAKTGWQLCQAGEKLPGNFSKGMSCISDFCEEDVNQNNYRQLWVGIKVLEDRQMRGMTQVAYAELFDISKSTVKAWENGRREPATYFWFLITFETVELQAAKARR